MQNHIKRKLIQQKSRTILECAKQYKSFKTNMTTSTLIKRSKTSLESKKGRAQKLKHAGGQRDKHYKGDRKKNAYGKCA